MRKVENILVTGGAGFIGSAFIRHVLNQRTFQGSIVNLDALTYAGNLENLCEAALDPRYIFVHGNINQSALVEHLCHEHAIDTIIHFAAESHVDRSIVNPETFIETNIVGTFRLLEVVRKIPTIHFHHVSTDEVYGCLGETGVFTEKSPYQPNSPYSASKASSDHMVRAYYQTYGLSTCISNCSNNYGPYQFPEKLIPLMILNCLQLKPLPVYGKGTNVRDWLYVDDHAKALWLLLHQGKAGEVYNIGGEQELRNIDLIECLISLLAPLQKIPVKRLYNLITYVADRPGHDFRYAIDCTKMKALGWAPTPSFAARLEETVQWYLHNPAWVQNIRDGSYRSWLNQHASNPIQY